MRLRITVLALIALLSSHFESFAQEQSIARQWMEVALEMVRLDGQGPTLHSRNLYHTSAAMYDAWAVYDDQASPLFLGHTVGDYEVPFEGFTFDPAKVDSLRRLTITYAAFRVLDQRFNNYGTKGETIEVLYGLMDELGLKRSNLSTEYQDGDAIALGNYIGEQIVAYGFQDGSHEEDNHEAFRYLPINKPIIPNRPGNPTLGDHNRWQPIDIREYLDARMGDPSVPENYYRLVGGIDNFLNPEWGEVRPFALTKEDHTIAKRANEEWQMYLDPGPPPLLDYASDSLASEHYKWGFMLVSQWSSYLDPADGEMIDISPGARGNQVAYPASYADFPQFYDLQSGTAFASGHPKNPATGKPYAPNVVPRGDYTRVIAEYWVDGIDTYSPPGHWIKNMQDVSDHPDFEKRWRGEGPVLTDLDWDIKSYLAMTGALHDAAIAAWGVKGYYDYIRPISAIRFMADQGQCSDPALPRYHKLGLPLVPGFSELVDKKDPLAGKNGEHVNKIKVRAWRGPEAIKDAKTDVAGVDWILAENWWPYQRYSFTTPPFAGYVSGHSTFSTTGAEVLTQITGDPFFPGGMQTFTAKKDEFLVFEKGPSQDITLQWATYHDAANETCLSRLIGGIHPPADDMPARKMGMKVAAKALGFAEACFQGKR